ncbi:MAG: GYD domain-containing protein [Acetobacteraceae bacterium]|nr:GYD domain-containing protein [Acetobacteraceae bacterium]
MTTYVVLANWTDQGVRNIRDSAKRWDAAKRMLQDMGGSIRDFYMTMGEFDLIVVYEAPDDAIAARFTLMLGGLGNVRTKTLKAFPEQAYREIVNSLA